MAAQQPGPESEVNSGLGRLPANHYHGIGLCFDRRKRESEDEKRREPRRQSTQLAPKLWGALGFLPELGYSRSAIIAGALDTVAPSSPLLSLEPCSELQAELKPDCIEEQMDEVFMLGTFLLLHIWPLLVAVATKLTLRKAGFYLQCS